MQMKLALIVFQTTLSKENRIFQPAKRQSKLLCPSSPEEQDLSRKEQDFSREESLSNRWQVEPANRERNKARKTPLH